MKRMFLKSTLIFTASAILLTFYSCIPFGDGGIAVTGVVYEWVDAPAGETSRIYVEVCDKYEQLGATAENIIANIPDGITKVALENATVALGDKKEIETRGGEYYLYKVNTTSDGSFKESWMTSTAKSKFLIKATKPGYMVVTEEADFTGATNYAIVALLVRSNPD